MVNFSQGENGAPTADKSVTDIKNAYDAGRMVLGLWGGEIQPLLSADGPNVLFISTRYGEILEGSSTLEGTDTWGSRCYHGVIIRRWFEYE